MALIVRKGANVIDLELWNAGREPRRRPLQRPVTPAVLLLHALRLCNVPGIGRTVRSHVAEECSAESQE